MKKILFAIVLALVPAVAEATTVTAFFSHEVQPPYGMTKMCVYTYLGNYHSITIKRFSLCPLTIQVEQ